MRYRTQFVMGRSEYTVVCDDDPDDASLEIRRVPFPRLVGAATFPEEALIHATGAGALRLIAWLERDLLRCPLAELPRSAVA